MSYRRSYPVYYNEEQSNQYLQDIQSKIDKQGIALVLNDYPYDMFQDKQVKTEHWTLRYKEINWKVIILIEQHREQGYTILENGIGKSITSINHLHFIKHTWKQ